MNQQNPSNSRKHRALALFRAGQLAQAKTLYKEICGADRRDAEAWYMLGTIHGIHGDSRQAESCLRRAIGLRPTYALAYNDLGLELYHQDRIEEAIASYKKALNLQPDFAAAYCNLGLALYTKGTFEDSIASCQQALRLKLEHHEVYNTLGLSLYALGKFDEALTCYRKALQLKPDYPEAYYNISFVELSRGHFADSWRYYVYRHFLPSQKSLPPPSSLPLDLTGRRLLVGHDQGLGDELFFLRFLSQLKARGAWVAYCPNPNLASMLARVVGIDRIAAPGEPIEALDYTFSVTDLPLLLGMDDVSKIPPPLRLAALPERVEQLRSKLAALGPAPYLGVTWRAGTKDTRKLYKETPRERLAEVLRGIPSTVLILQRHPQPGEVKAFGENLGRPVHDFCALNEDLEEMLALLDLLEDYVGVSNTNMHLRAGLGKTARVLVPHPPEWRWMAEGGESPWFKGFAVYRQAHDKIWKNAFETLERDLRNAYGD